MPLANDTVQVTTEAAPVCGRAGAQKVALTTAAIETIKRDYDRFVVVGGGYQNNVGVVGTTPLVSNSTGNFSAYGYGNTIQGYGSGTTTTYGGQPIIGGSRDQALVVKMFHADDANAGNAVDARSILGPDWQKIVAKGAPKTCE